jgi:hypothetical protein
VLLFLFSSLSKEEGGGMGVSVSLPISFSFLKTKGMSFFFPPSLSGEERRKAPLNKGGAGVWSTRYSVVVLEWGLID